MKSVLILEDNPGIMAGVNELLRLQFPEIKQLPARNVAEAQLLLAEFPVDLFLLDIELPDGNGIDFLCDIRTVHPTAAAVIMTATPLPAYRAQAEQLGVIRFLEKPFELEQMAALVKAALFPGKSGSVSSFVGSLSGLTVMDIVQLKCLGGATQVVKLSIPSGDAGAIHFRKGQIIHATTESGLTGVDAVNKIVSWRRGQVEESTDPVAEKASVQGDWQGVLLEAVRIMDETAAS